MNQSSAVNSSATRGVSRRNALLVPLAAAPFGCRRTQPGATAAPPDSGPTREWGGLKVARVSGLDEGQRGGTAVVVLHGWGAPGDDLLPLAEAWSRSGARFFVPAAPLAEMGGGRAWWHLDPNTRPPHALNDQVDPAFKPNPEVVAARTAVQGLLRTIVDRYAPQTVALVGFSQGAMLAIDVALAGGSGVHRVVAMSGVLLLDSVAALNARHPAPPRFLLSHGRQDPIVPFQSGERAKELLEKHGLLVNWAPFDGGHTIPPTLIGEVDRFLFPPA